MQVYKLNVQQGNIVTQDMLDKLKPGMTKRQVEYVMGNPVLKDTFSTRQWDYIYRTERQADNIKQYKIRIHFDQGQNYSHFEGKLPSSTAAVVMKETDKRVKVFGE